MPTIPANCVKMTQQFILQNGSDVPLEIAEFSIWSDDPTGVTDWDAWLADAASHAGTTWTSGVGKTHFSPAVVASKCIMGHYSTSETLLHEQAYSYGPTDWIGSGAKTLPWQVSLVLSLYAYERGTFVSNGKSKRGRIYLPPLADAMIADSTTGELDITTCESVRDNIGTWLAGLVSHSGPGGGSFHPVVLSRHLSQTNEVGWLSIDNKFDTQRRRAKSLPVLTSTVAWP